MTLDRDTVTILVHSTIHYTIQYTIQYNTVPGKVEVDKFMFHGDKQSTLSISPNDMLKYNI